MTERLAAWIDAHADGILAWMLVGIGALLAFALVYTTLCAVGLAS